MNDELKALLESLELSEDTVTQMQTILEGAMKAVKDEAAAEREALEEAHAAEITFLKEKADEYGVYLKEKANEYGDFLKGKANAYGEHIKESVSGKMKEYADYAVEQFITENKERFVETEEYARMKSAFEYIKEAFEKNAFNVREDVAVVELQENLAESTRQYEALFEDLNAARTELNTINRTLILERATADLADTQKEKVNELLEAVSFETLDEYKDGVAMIVEQAKASAAVVVEEKKEEILKEDTQVISTNTKKVDPTIANWLSRPGLF